MLEVVFLILDNEYKAQRKSFSPLDVALSKLKSNQSLKKASLEFTI